jgi:hypothetical protein
MAIFVTGFASPSSAIQQQKMYGVMDDNPVMGAASQAGFNVVKKTIWISPTNNSWDNPTSNPKIVPLPAEYRQVITTDLEAAKASHIQVIIELYPVIQYGQPGRPSQMRGTCDVAKDIVDRWPDTVTGVEVGVEPNNYTFANHQFNPDGTQASAAPYEKWLSICYDTIKKDHPEVLVIGGSLASHGEDDPHKATSSTSPVLFLQKFCEAYKNSGRSSSLPIMDVLDMHNYPDPTDQDPSVQHPYPSTTITIADYNKLDGLLGCFGGTAQPKPWILWGEGGYNTVVPDSQKQYKGNKPSSVHLVDEPTQGRYAAQAIQMAYCQPHTLGWINFHFVDDPNLAKDWQSGFAYAPLKASKRRTSDASVVLTLKQSMPPVRKALDAANNGTMKCG